LVVAVVVIIIIVVRRIEKCYFSLLKSSYIVQYIFGIRFLPFPQTTKNKKTRTNPIISSPITYTCSLVLFIHPLQYTWMIDNIKILFFLFLDMGYWRTH
jgi:hypothetical protein